MDKKVKSIVIALMVLLLSLAFSSFVSFDVDVASGSEHPWWPGWPEIVTGTENVTWDFYVVGAYQTNSPSITPAPQPSGFNFTVVDGGMMPGHTGSGPGWVAGGFDYGALGEYGETGYMSGWGWVRVNITNNLGQDVVVTDLIAEVTDGTETEDFPMLTILGACNADPGAYNQTTNATCPEVATMGNFTFVNFQSLDLYVDEADYYAGTATVVYDTIAKHDQYAKDLGQTNWWTELPTGPATLLGPDSGGDAAATGHVAPILLRNGETFDELFGAGIFGNASVPTQITGTIQLTLMYERITTPNYVDIIDVSMNATVNLYRTDTVEVNVTVKNTGGPSMDMNVSLYGLTKAVFPINATGWDGGNMTQIGTTQLVSLAGGANITLTFYWSLANAPQGQTVPVWAVAWAFGSSFYYDELWDQITTLAWGDVDGDGDVDFFDLGKVILIYSGFLTGPPELVERADLDFDGDVDFFDLGKMILIYSGFL